MSVQTCPRVACAELNPPRAIYCGKCGARLNLDDGKSKRKLTKALVGERPKKHYSECRYCGRPCLGEVCAQHREIARLEDAEQRGSAA